MDRKPFRRVARPLTLMADTEELIRHQKKDKKWLQRKTKPQMHTNGSCIRSVELFAGAGGLSLGLNEYTRRIQASHKIEFALEWDANVLKVLSDNLKPVSTLATDVENIINGKSLKSKRLTKKEQAFVEEYTHAKKPDILMGGPPCQGNSNANNHSRRTDSRNKLYLKMVRAAIVLNPRIVIIENVRDVVRSVGGEVQTAIEVFEQLGYKVSHEVLKASDVGVAQTRSRHFLIASKGRKPDFSILEQFKLPKARTLKWAIWDLRDKLTTEGEFNSTTKGKSKLNQERMQWLIDNDEYELCYDLKPDCHKRKNTHPAVYGRMHWDEPSSTLTAGFTSNGQGRYTHPDADPGRTITPHEAARIQSFPDWYKFPDNVKRGILTKGIGNAVPPLLAMYVCHVALSSLDE